MSKKKGGPDPYMKYSGVAYQMIAILGASWWIGSKADQYFQTETPYYTAGLMSFMLITYLWKLVIALNNEPK